MLKEFKEFAMKGNVIDLAVGVIIGTAFQKIVNSLVNDVIMPCISLLTGKIDFSNMAFTIGDVSVKYGSFITTIVNFLIISFSVFLLVKYVNKLNKIEMNKLKDLNDKFVNQIDKKGKFKRRKKQVAEEVPAPAEPETKVCPYCLTEIKYKATRCPHCTSEQPIEEVKEKNTDTSLSEDTSIVE